MKVAFVNDMRLELRLSIFVATKMSDAFCNGKMHIDCLSVTLQVIAWRLHSLRTRYLSFAQMPVKNHTGFCHEDCICD